MTTQEWIKSQAEDPAGWSSVIMYGDYTSCQTDFEKAKERVLLGMFNNITMAGSHSMDIDEPDTSTIFHVYGDYGYVEYWVHEDNLEFWEYWGEYPYEDVFSAMDVIHRESEDAHLLDEYGDDDPFETQEDNDHWNKLSMSQRLSCLRTAADLHGTWVDWYSFLRTEDKEEAFMATTREEALALAPSHEDIDTYLHLLEGGHHGQYIGQELAIDILHRTSTTGKWHDVSEENLVIMAAGPDCHEGYAEAWSDTEMSATFYTNGTRGLRPELRWRQWHLWPNDDLWLCDSNMPEKISNEYFS